MFPSVGKEYISRCLKSTLIQDYAAMVIFSVFLQIKVITMLIYNCIIVQIIDYSLAKRLVFGMLISSYDNFEDKIRLRGLLSNEGACNGMNCVNTPKSIRLNISPLSEFHSAVY